MVSAKIFENCNHHLWNTIRYPSHYIICYRFKIYGALGVLILDHQNSGIFNLGFGSSFPEIHIYNSIKLSIVSCRYSMRRYHHQSCKIARVKPSAPLDWVLQKSSIIQLSDNWWSSHTNTTPNKFVGSSTQPFENPRLCLYHCNFSPAVLAMTLCTRNCRKNQWNEYPGVSCLILKNWWLGKD